jgi:putative ABC transport system permease protein
MNWIKQLFSRKRNYGDLSAEIEEHLAEKVDELVAGGMSREEATFTARREFGNVLLIEERSREVWQWPSLEDFFRDVRYGARQLRKNPGFTAVAVLTLALGIGANTAIFSVVYAVLVRPLPFKDPARLVMVWETWEKRGENRVVVSPANFNDWKEQSKTLDHITAMWWYGSVVTIQGEPTNVPAVRVTSDFFDALGVNPARGRPFSPEEQSHDGYRVAILSDAVWRKLGGDPALVGRNVELNQKPYTVIGIMPPGFNFPSDDDVWFPLPKGALVGDRGWHYLRVMAKLKPGITLGQAQSEMDSIAARLRQAYPNQNGNMGVGVNVVPLREQTIGEVRRALLVLLAAVVCLLLIACANVASLMLARATARQREFGFRLALGARRWQLVRSVLTESILLASAGGAFGVAGAYLGVRAFVVSDPIKLPRVQEIAVDPSMLLFTLLVAVSTGVLFGLAPAWRSSRLELHETLKDDSERHCGKPARTRTRSTLAVVQIALSIVLLTGAGLLLRSFTRRVSVPLGFRPDGVLAVELPWSINARIDELLDRLRALPGVQSAGAATSFPHDPPNTSGLMEIEGRPVMPGDVLEAGVTVVTSDYFRAAGMTLREGRFIAPSDTATAPPVAIINEALALRYFPGQDPIGRRIRREGNIWHTIVGIVGNMKGFGVDGDPMPNIYFSRLQDDWTNPVYVLIRTAIPPSSLAGVVRKEIHAWDKNVAISKLAPVEDLLAESVMAPRFYMLLVVAFAALALTVAAVGLYGLLSYSVARRTHEIGVRMALGAERGDVLAMILRQGFTLILIGVVLGLASAWAATRTLESMLFQVHATDAASLGGACLVLIAVGLLACYIPARRATKVDPMVALRYE